VTGWSISVKSAFKVVIIVYMIIGTSGLGEKLRGLLLGVNMVAYLVIMHFQ
jgi:hypothetical protein